jgi:hypothetical protein
MGVLPENLPQLLAPAAHTVGKNVQLVEVTDIYIQSEAPSTVIFIS